jgi:hypothetical protein
VPPIHEPYRAEADRAIRIQVRELPLVPPRLAVDSLVLADLLHLWVVAEKLRLGQYNLSWWVVTEASPAHRQQEPGHNRPLAA